MNNKYIRFIDRSASLRAAAAMLAFVSFISGCVETSESSSQLSKKTALSVGNEVALSNLSIVCKSKVDELGTVASLHGVKKSNLLNKISVMKGCENTRSFDSNDKWTILAVDNGQAQIQKNEYSDKYWASVSHLTIVNLAKEVEIESKDPDVITARRLSSKIIENEYLNSSVIEENLTEDQFQSKQELSRQFVKNVLFEENQREQIEMYIKYFREKNENPSPREKPKEKDNSDATTLKTLGYKKADVSDEGEGVTVFKAFFPISENQKKGDNLSKEDYLDGEIMFYAIHDDATGETVFKPESKENSFSFEFSPLAYVTLKNKKPTFNISAQRWDLNVKFGSKKLSISSDGKEIFEKEIKKESVSYTKEKSGMYENLFLSLEDSEVEALRTIDQKSKLSFNIFGSKGKVDSSDDDQVAASEMRDSIIESLFAYDTFNSLKNTD